MMTLDFYMILVYSNYLIKVKEEKMKFSVLGSGRWGSFISWYLSYKEFPVTVWGRAESASFAKLAATRKNEYVTLPESIRFTTDLREAVDFADNLYKIPVTEGACDPGTRCGASG